MEVENMVQEVIEGQTLPEATTTWAESVGELTDGAYEDTGLEFDTTEKNIRIEGTPDQRKKLFESLSEYFSEVKNPENTMVNTAWGGKGVKYSPLNEVLNSVRPVLAKYGLYFTQSPTFDGTNCYVSTLLMHKEGACMLFPSLMNKPTKPDIQGMGSALTYLRRFSLNAILGIMGEVDDDGNAASNSSTKETEVKKESAKKSETSHDKLRDLCRTKMAEAKKAGKDQEMRSKLDEITKGINGLTEEEAQKAIDEVSKL